MCFHSPSLGVEAKRCLQRGLPKREWGEARAGVGGLLREQTPGLVVREETYVWGGESVGNEVTGSWSSNGHGPEEGPHCNLPYRGTGPAPAQAAGAGRTTLKGAEKKGPRQDPPTAASARHQGVPLRPATSGDRGLAPPVEPGCDPAGQEVGSGAGVGTAPSPPGTLAPWHPVHPHIPHGPPRDCAKRRSLQT